ncbi:MAG: M23 family metallopeptidase [Bacillota bacterium]|nr:M23 family metallopeptidase [Bacillota bacterium]
MIKSIAQLAFMYVITRTFVELAFPAGKHLLKYIYWSALILTLLIAIGPRVTQLFDDIHNASVTYSKVKDSVQSVTDTVNSYPEAKESIPIVGTGASKYPPSITLWEKIRPSSIRFEWPVKGEITQGYNDKNHGLDIACNEETTVKAARDGTVMAINSDNVYGNYVMVDHGGQWATLYAHLSKVTVTKGQHVFSKSQLGLSGNTGNSTGPHLHFEIRVGGKTIDPMGYLKK